MAIPADRLESVLMQAVEQAITGELSDTTRVGLYRLALTIAAEEFYRLAETGSKVEPAVLMLIQQIAALCEDNVDVARLVSAQQAASLTEPAIQLAR